jgi:hypothetical protein
MLGFIEDTDSVEMAALYIMLSGAVSVMTLLLSTRPSAKSSALDRTASLFLPLKVFAKLLACVGLVELLSRCVT